jgi:Homoserine dehydrogenase, NAD binding domain
MKVLIRGCGVVGARAARQLLSVASLDSILLDDPRRDHARRVAESLGPTARALAEHESWADAHPDIVVLAGPAPHHDDAEIALRNGAHVVSVSDDLHDVERLLQLDAVAKSTGRVLLVGAGFAPGLTCILARHASEEVEVVEEVHVAKFGTAGPACARQHHQALKHSGRDWRDGAWVDVPGGSGRELCWFPDPIAGADCYRAALPDPLLLHQSFPGAARITARVSATRRDRLTSRLPMLRKPHAEAGTGAIRVEVRGLRNGRFEVIVLGCIDRPSVASATVLAVAVDQLVSGRCSSSGAGGLGTMVEPVPFLKELARRGVKCARFEGSPSHVV